MILEKVLNTINKYRLIEKNDKIVLGLSGGPDSVCLLHILTRLREELEIEIYAAHLNHQIRGMEAQKDALYVSELCEKLGVTFFIKSVDVPKYCQENGLSIEEGARKLRYEMFDEIKQKTRSNKIAIGQNSNDQVETVLMRMMRGTGLQGLRGIEYIRDNELIRPILDIDRKEIELYCEQHNLNPRIDKTNLENIYTRNKIRLELIPYMKENFNPNVVESIFRMSNTLKDDSDYIDSVSEKEFEKTAKLEKDSTIIFLEDFTSLHKSIKVRIIRNSIKNILGDTNFIDQKHVEDVIELESESKMDKRIDLPRGVIVYRKKGTIILTTREIINEEIEFCYNVPNNGFIKIKEIDMIVEAQTMSIERYKSKKADKLSKVFDFSKIEGGIVVRNRKPGDKIKLHAGTKKIKDLFIDLKIPKDDRDKIPMILDEKEVICIGDYKVSENYKIDMNTKEVLKITFKKL